MRRWQKNRCIETLDLLKEAHEEIDRLLTTGETDQIEPLTDQCLSGAMSVIKILDSLERKGTKAAGLLKKYRSRMRDPSEPVTIPELDDLLSKTEESILQDLPERYEAVFLTYSASMWDSFESIYRAAEADPRCNAICMPIPWYDKNPDGTFGEMHYERERIPTDIHVEDYRKYDLTIHHPEMIFIHYPYDEFNNATSIDPAYYSTGLMDLTERLVYVPYYATAGNFDPVQSLMPVYYCADEIVVQSETIMGFYDKSVPKDKFLPYGSPKFDSIIKHCANPPEPPEEWKERLKGKRVYFFNTSISGFLGNTETFIRKMDYVFDVFKHHPEVCLIWRPHPLLESTMNSMRPEVRPYYEEVKNRFIKENIGILDETPGIETTIALCDAFIGDAGTSVTALFGVVGKRIFLLDNKIMEKPDEDDWTSSAFKTLRSDRNDKYCITMGNRLFVDEDGDHQYRYLCDISDEYSGGGYYKCPLEVEGEIVVFPANAQHILKIDPKSLKKKIIPLEYMIDSQGAFAGVFNLPASKNPWVYWLLPNKYPAMVRFDCKTEEISYLTDEAFSEGYGVYITDREERILSARWVTAQDIPGISIKGAKLMCLSADGKRLRAIELQNPSCEERDMPLNGTYTGVLIDPVKPDVIWFLPHEGTILARWTLSTDRVEYADVRVEGLKSIRRPERTLCDDRYFSNAAFSEGRMILAPRWGNKFVEFNTETLEAKEWDTPFAWAVDDISDYRRNNGIGDFYLDRYNHNWYFNYTPEHRTYRLDISEHTCEEIPITFNKDEVLRFARGFHAESQWMPYCCKEDLFNTLEDIVTDNIHGDQFDREKQIEAYKHVNASPEGDCGEKVYREILAYLSKPRKAGVWNE